LWGFICPAFCAGQGDDDDEGEYTTVQTHDKRFCGAKVAVGSAEEKRSPDELSEWLHQLG
jgi:hypothetical protein